MAMKPRKYCFRAFVCVRYKLLLYSAGLDIFTNINQFVREKLPFKINPYLNSRSLISSCIF